MQQNINFKFQIFPSLRLKDAPIDITLKDFVFLLTTGCVLGENFLSRIQKIRTERNKELRANGKLDLPSVLFQVRVNGKPQAGNIISYTKFVVLDFDFPDNTQFAAAGGLEEAKKALWKDPYVWIGFISTSGNGLKLLVPVSSDMEHHRLAFEQLCSYYKEKYDITADRTGDDLVRGCTISYDWNPIVHIEPEIYPVNTESGVTITQMQK